MQWTEKRTKTYNAMHKVFEIKYIIIVCFISRFKMAENNHKKKPVLNKLLCEHYIHFMTSSNWLFSLYLFFKVDKWWKFNSISIDWTFCDRFLHNLNYIHYLTLIYSWINDNKILCKFLANFGFVHNSRKASIPINNANIHYKNIILHIFDFFLDKIKKKINGVLYSQRTKQNRHFF